MERGWIQDVLDWGGRPLRWLLDSITGVLSFLAFYGLVPGFNRAESLEVACMLGALSSLFLLASPDGTRRRYVALGFGIAATLILGLEIRSYNGIVIPVLLFLPVREVYAGAQVRPVIAAVLAGWLAWDAWLLVSVLAEVAIQQRDLDSTNQIIELFVGQIGMVMATVFLVRRMSATSSFRDQTRREIRILRDQVRMLSRRQALVRRASDLVTTGIRAEEVARDLRGSLTAFSLSFQLIDPGDDPESQAIHRELAQSHRRIAAALVRFLEAENQVEAGLQWDLNRLLSEMRRELSDSPSAPLVHISLDDPATRVEAHGGVGLVLAALIERAFGDAGCERVALRGRRASPTVYRIWLQGRIPDGERDRWMEQILSAMNWSDPEVDDLPILFARTELGRVGGWVDVAAEGEDGLCLRLHLRSLVEEPARSDVPTV